MLKLITTTEHSYIPDDIKAIANVEFSEEDESLNCCIALLFQRLQNLLFLLGSNGILPFERSQHFFILRGILNR